MNVASIPTVLSAAGSSTSSRGHNLALKVSRKQKATDTFLSMQTHIDSLPYPCPSVIPSDNIKNKLFPVKRYIQNLAF